MIVLNQDEMRGVILAHVTQIRDGLLFPSVHGSINDKQILALLKRAVEIAETVTAKKGKEP